VVTVSATTAGDESIDSTLRPPVGGSGQASVVGEPVPASGWRVTRTP
jgi:hypothetical protein